MKGREGAISIMMARHLPSCSLRNHPQMMFAPGGKGGGKNQFAYIMVPYLVALHCFPVNPLPSSADHGGLGREDRHGRPHLGRVV